jgi:DNA-directed RNA polymerase subunit beta
LPDLDDSGIVRIGAEVKSGDILVGKITPKGETQLSPEEKLLRAIFGEKAGDVRDTSLRVPPGVQGTVINAKVFSRRGIDKDERAQDIEDAEIAKLEKDQNDQIKIIRKSAYRKIRELLIGQKAATKLVDDHGRCCRTGSGSDGPRSSTAIPQMYWNVVEVDRKSGVPEKIERIVERPPRGDSGHPGSLPGEDQQAQEGRRAASWRDQDGQGLRRHQAQASGGRQDGRSPRQQGCHLADPARGGHAVPRDGTPVEMVLNPLGVPSRMNVGQILETPRLGRSWSGHAFNELLDEKYSSRRLRDELKRVLQRFGTTRSTRWTRRPQAGDPQGEVRCAPGEPRLRRCRRARHPRRALSAPASTHRAVVLFDGRTGDVFEGDVTVGVMYVLKLHHLVDDKIHARSIGPYSLVTQQPLGGKAQFGGQRLGEMEVWAMEAYGAAYALQEFLTVKSDDVLGRTRMYEAIVKGENVLESGLPESFNVLIKELQSLALDVELIESEQV